MRTELTGTRKPTAEEKNRGAEVVFIRHDKSGREYKILGAKCYESFEQWGESVDILRDNVNDIERWRKSFNNF